MRSHLSNIVVVENTDPVEDTKDLIEVKNELDGDVLDDDFNIIPDLEIYNTGGTLKTEDLKDSQCRFPYSCSICQRTFDNVDEYQEHSENHQNLFVKHECEICNKKFKNYAKFERHKTKHQSKEINCDLSLKTFNRETQYVKHLVSHTKHDDETPDEEIYSDQNQQNIESDVCSQQFKSVNSLATHKRKHVKKDRMLACNICGQIFNQVSHVKRHEMSHDVAVGLKRSN